VTALRALGGDPLACAGAASAREVIDLVTPARDQAMPRPAAGALIAVVIAGLLAGAGCPLQSRTAPPPPPPRTSGATITAYLHANAACQQATVELLRELEAEHSGALHVEVIDIDDEEGARRWREAGFDSVAILINGSSTVTWGGDDQQRTVSFLHTPGFAWAHADLREAVEAALAQRIVPAEPAEAEAVRLVDVPLRAQSVRVGRAGAETGQLVMHDQIVLQVTQARADLAPGQRVSAAAAALTEVLQHPFTPNQLTTARVEGGIAVLAGEHALLVATDEDARAVGVQSRDLADRWRIAIRDAIITAALQRSNAAQAQ